ncbi:MAG: lysophospholipid acyltransferase family protein [Chitinophagales bacterium]
MQLLLFVLSIPFIYFFSILPYPILRLLGDLIYFILYRIMRYRIAVVRKNIAHSFPEADTVTLRRYEKAFYRTFSDVIIETIKTFTYSKKFLLKHCQFENMSLIEKYMVQDRNILLVLGHYGNWEWGGAAFSLAAGEDTLAAYKPLRNPYFDKLMHHSRSRFGLHLIPKRKLIHFLASNKNRPLKLILISDQSPNPKEHYWVQFLHQDTAVVTGMEKIARQYDYVVIYASIDKVKRGQYNVTFDLLSDNAKELEPVALTRMFMQKLEESIRRDPGPYLWSHRRWKLRKPAS